MDRRNSIKALIVGTVSTGVLVEACNTDGKKAPEQSVAKADEHVAPAGGINRMKEEAERLSTRLPDGAHIVLLDARGKGMTSEDFAEMLGSLRDVGTKDMAFVLGGPDGLSPLPGKKAGRSLAFGPQTWPHLLARALLTEQVYRALTILAGHPYHRA